MNTFEAGERVRLTDSAVRAHVPESHDYWRKVVGTVVEVKLIYSAKVRWTTNLISWEGWEEVRHLRRVE